MKAANMLVMFASAFVLCAMLLITLTKAPEVRALRKHELRVCANGPPTCDFASVQRAVDAASAGDVIKVAEGVYADVQARVGITQVVYLDKTLSIIGGFAEDDWQTPDPWKHRTTLEAGGRGRVIYITGEIEPALVGLRITGGNATGLGGGVWSTAFDAGGGVYVITATVQISNCRIFRNIASTSRGGGGGVALVKSNAILTRDYLYENTAGSASWGEGGGVAIYSGAPKLSLTAITDNIANAKEQGIGGGLYLENSATEVERTYIYGNIASSPDRGDGGGLYFGPGDRSSLTNVVIQSNRSGATKDSQGGGAYVEVAQPRLMHMTIARNSGGDGSGLAIVSYGDDWLSRTSLVNTIIVSQTIGVTATQHSAVTLTGVLWGGNGQNLGGKGVFTTTQQRNGDLRFKRDGFHLREGSAAIDQGIDAGVLVDIDGEARPFGDRPDLGADEWHPQPTPGATNTPWPTVTPAPTETLVMDSALYLPMINMFNE